MFTCCPHCHTCFRITKPQLDVAQGHVRCGTCSQVFNAKLYLHEELPGKTGKKPHPAESDGVTEKKKPLTSATASNKPEPAVEQKPKPRQPVTPTPDIRRQKTTTEKKPAPRTATPPPDIDLFDYASISHKQDIPGNSAKIEFEEQDIDDIFDDLESQHSLRQPDFKRHKKAEDQLARKESSSSHSDDVPATNDVDDTALIDISAVEDDWLSDLTPDIDAQDNKNEALLTDEEITEPLDIEPSPKVSVSTLKTEKQFEEPPEKSIPSKVTPAKVTPAKVTPGQKKPASRYEYVDPSELLKEEKGIVEILQDMDEQLSLEMDVSEYDHYDESQDSMIDPHFIKHNADKSSAAKTKTEKPQKPEQKPVQEPVADESDISGMFRHAIEEANVNKPSAEGSKKDDFESAFLASLDSTTLSPDIDSQKNTETPPLKTDEPVKPLTEIKPLPASNEDEFDLNTPSGFPELPGMEEDVPYQLRDNFTEEASSRSLQTWAFYITAAIILLSTAILQLVVFRSTDLADHFPSLEPALTRLCKTLPCRYTGPQDISQIKLLSRDIRIHPREEKALLITATMVNRARFRQPYPNIEITLSDLSGDVVARRQFSAEEYLGRIYTPLLRMPAGQPVQIALEVIDPGRDAVNFEFTFH